MYIQCIECNILESKIDLHSNTEDFYKHLKLILRHILAESTQTSKVKNN